MSDPHYRRVIVKLSGEALSGGDPFGINQVTVESLGTLGGLLGNAPDKRSGNAAGVVDKVVAKSTLDTQVSLIDD